MNGVAVAVAAYLAADPDRFSAEAAWPGAAAWDGCAGEATIAALKARGDIVVVALHLHLAPGWTDETPPAHLAIAERALAAGADVVIGHGPHVPQGILAHDGGIALLSLGNFLFRPDYAMPEPAHRAVVGRVSVFPERLVLMLLPFRLDDSGRLQRPRHRDASRIVQQMRPGPPRSVRRDRPQGAASQATGIRDRHPRYIEPVPRLQRKGFGGPDEIRRFPNGVVEIVTLDEIAVSHFLFQPGWTWKTDVGPIAGTETCQHRHVGYTISGRLSVRMADGTALSIGPGDAYEIPPGHLAWVEGDVPWESVEFTSGHAYGKSPDDLGERVLATIVFSDICDSTATLARIGDAEWTRVVREHNERIRTVIDRFRGRELATLGDGFLALFDGAGKAVLAAAAMDPAVAGLGIHVRAGVHTGELAIVGGQARGVAVHAAARVAALAGPGEVLVSGTTHDLLDGAGLSFEFRGAHELKGLSGARPIFALTR